MDLNKKQGCLHEGSPVFIEIIEKDRIEVEGWLVGKNKHLIYMYISIVVNCLVYRNLILKN